MDTNIDIKIQFEGKSGLFEVEGECDLYSYPDEGLYWTKKMSKVINHSPKVSEIVKKIESLYMVDNPDVSLFDQVDNSSNIDEYDTVEITETITGDFSYFELEMVAEDANIDPNWPMKTQYVYDVQNAKDKPRKIFVISDDGEEMNITEFI